MERLLTTEECAERTGFSVNYMRQILRQGDLPAVRVGNQDPGKRDQRKYLVDPADLTQYIMDKKQRNVRIGVRDKTVRAWREASRRQDGNH